MKAITLSNPGHPSTFIFADLPIPEAGPDQAVIRIKAFGINHAEIHMRKGEWAEADLISGVECVGLIHACPGGHFAIGTKVAALMGGMGRTIHGSYAEYTCVPIGHVVPIEANLSWEELAALPESYATAWSALFRNLELMKGERLLVRGGTSALGQAAINLAVNAGAEVVATTRNLGKEGVLKEMGVKKVAQEGADLSKRLPERSFDKVLDLVGNSALLDSMKLVRRGGRVCMAGWLGGLAPIPDFNPLLQMPSGVHFSLFASPHFGLPGFPVSDVPLQSIAEDVAAGRFKAKPAGVFRFKDIMKAHEAAEKGAGGKLVVVLDE